MLSKTTKNCDFIAGWKKSVKALFLNICTKWTYPVSPIRSKGSSFSRFWPVGDIFREARFTQPFDPTTVVHSKTYINFRSRASTRSTLPSWSCWASRASSPSREDYRPSSGPTSCRPSSWSSAPSYSRPSVSKRRLNIGVPHCTHMWFWTSVVEKVPKWLTQPSHFLSFGAIRLVRWTRCATSFSIIKRAFYCLL